MAKSATNKMTVGEWASLIKRVYELCGLPPPDDNLPNSRSSDNRLTFGAWKQAIEEARVTW